MDGAVTTAITDSAGRFALYELPAGPRVLTAGHPALDALGLATLGRVTSDG